MRFTLRCLDDLGYCPLGLVRWNLRNKQELKNSKERKLIIFGGSKWMWEIAGVNKIIKRGQTSCRCLAIFAVSNCYIIQILSPSNLAGLGMCRPARWSLCAILSFGIPICPTTFRLIADTRRESSSQLTIGIPNRRRFCWGLLVSGLFKATFLNFSVAEPQHFAIYQPRAKYGQSRCNSYI